MLKTFNFRKAILLIHGFAGGCYDYGDFANDLQLTRGFDVYTFTLAGHDKPKINNVTKDDWLKSAETQMEKIIKNGYKNIYVIGHSMGGIIATHLASKYKEVKKLVLAAPAFYYLSFKNNKLNIIESIKKVPTILKDYTPEEVISRIQKVPITTIKEFMTLAGSHLKDISKIEIPTLILYGIKDELVPIESVNYVYNNISSNRVTLLELKNITHDMFINNRYEEIKKIIVKFLKEYNLNIKERKII